jgi:hypothetical protein
MQYNKNQAPANSEQSIFIDSFKTMSKTLC